MPFSKSFAKTSEKSPYTKWVEVYLNQAEDLEQDELARQVNIKLMKECMADAKNIIETENLKRYQMDLVHIAIALFEKRASHAIYFKENKAKEKFDRMR
jgi:hypothetical protein